MDVGKLTAHIKLCKRNLKSKRVKCCAVCPFEEEILIYYPELEGDFRAKQIRMEREIG